MKPRCPDSIEWQCTISLLWIHFTSKLEKIHVSNFLEFVLLVCMIQICNKDSKARWYID
jgi:hypothetical protein